MGLAITNPNNYSNSIMMNSNRNQGNRGYNNGYNNDRRGYNNNRGDNDNRRSNYNNNNNHNNNNNQYNHGGNRGNHYGRNNTRSYQARKYQQHAEMFAQAGLPAQSSKPYENRAKQDDVVINQIGAASIINNKNNENNNNENGNHQPNIQLGDDWKENIQRPNADN